MEIEQLKLILETLQGVGHEAGNLAVLYLWLKFGGGIFTNLCMLVGVGGAAYLIYRGVSMAQRHDASDTFFRDMRDQLRIGSGGYLSDSEHQSTMVALRQLVATEKQRNKEKQA